MMSKFRKKPVIIDAIQWTGKNRTEIARFMNKRGVSVGFNKGVAFIPTLEGLMQATPGDWIIKGIKDEFYPCKPDIFEKTYEPVE